MVKDIDNPTNAAFVESFQAEYGRLPSLYASQGFDTANLLISALERPPVSDADAFRAALRAADFDSTRGDFAFGPNHHPIQDIYAREVVKEGDVFTNRIIGWRSRTTRRLRRPSADVTRPARRAGFPRAGPLSRAAADLPDGRPHGSRAPMSTILIIEQVLNGLQFGVMLFLMAAGLTLIFGVMGLINLAHGSLYMVGAFAAAAVAGRRLVPAGAGRRLAAAAMAGALIEMVVIRRLYDRDHLDQVLATFALILIFSEGTRWVFGSFPLFLDIPDYGCRGRSRCRRHPVPALPAA
jgi:hypothetical protein